MPTTPAAVPTAALYTVASGATLGVGNTVPAAPVAEFIGSPTSGTTPLTVTFTDQTTGTVSSWAWDFGDGGTSTSQNPSHAYLTAGFFAVALTATGPGGSNTRTRSSYVSATAPSPPPPPPPGPEYSDSDWIARKSGASVIAAHAFDYDAEVTQHLGGDPDPVSTPVPVRRVVDDAGFGCLEQVVIGAELAAAYTAGSTTMVINNDYLWPDPATDGSFYFMVAKAYPASTSKNVFLCTARSGTTLTVAYQSTYSSTNGYSAFAAGAQSYSIGDYAGNESNHEWRRTFAALPSGENGLPTNDPAASGAVPLRSKLSGNAYSVPRDASYWQYGWYGHASNQTTWQNWTPWIGTTTYTTRGPVNGADAKYRLWDGDTIYIQFRMKISRRLALQHSQPDPASTQYWIRKTFAVQSEVSSVNQLVVDAGPATIWDIPDTPGIAFRLGTYKDARTVGVNDWARPSGISYQKGSAWDVAPYYADLRSSGKPAVGCSTPDGAAAWKFPDDEWVTIHMKIKPGRSNVAETQIKIEFARQDKAGYTGAYTTVLDVTDANIVYSGSGDVDFPDGAFTSATVARMDALPGYQSFGLMGYLNLFQAAGWVPPRASYAIRMSQVIFSQAPIPAPAATAKPSWLTAATSRTWVSVPQTTTLASLDVTGNPSIVPSGADWIGSGFNGLFAWSTHRWDDINRRFSIGPAGGHTDYGGNDVLDAYVGSSANWRRVKLPSGALPGPALVGNDGNESTGLYSDGSLRAQHTYHNHRHIPGYGDIIVRSTAHFRAGTGDVLKAWSIDRETGKPRLRCDFSAITAAGTGEGSFDYDSTRNCLWHVGSGTSKWIKFTALGSDTWTATDQSSAPGLPRDNYLPSAGAIRYVRSADRIATFPSYVGLGTGRLGVMNPNTLTFITPTVTGSFSAGFVAPDMSGNQPGCGFEWCEPLGCFLLWNNTSATTEISTLSPTVPADWSQPWVRGVLTVDGSNVVTPTATISSGVFGRAMYSPALDALLLHVTTSTPLLAFKL